MTEQDLRFDGKVALVTGAGGGLGRDYARLLAQLGARVVVSDNGASVAGDGSVGDPANQVVEEIRAAGGEAIAFTGDLSVEREARGGGGSLPRWLWQDRCDRPQRRNCTGHDRDRQNSLGPLRPRSGGVSTFAPFWMINAAWAHMRSQGGGDALC
ncbi:SDR family NAD(P)-dependent oxidoreductase [Novosphingobium colocasiae]